MLTRLFKPRPARAAGAALYARVTAQSRTPALYLDFGCPDTPEGRFEVYSLHVYLLLERLKGQGPQAAEIAQALFDTYVSDLDNALRELGVGDLSVGKKMRKLGEAFYGRVRSYEGALAAKSGAQAIAEVLGRTVYAGLGEAPALRLAAYVLANRAALAAQPLEAICGGVVEWSAP